MRNRNTLPLLSRAVPSRSSSPVPSSSFEVYTADPPPKPTIPIPAIRLVQATPSPDSTAADVSVDTAPILTPKEHPSPRKRLVPKKSKLALLASRATGAASVREKDLSDVVRRVGQGQEQGWGMDQDGACNVTVNGGTARSVKALGIGKGRSRKNQSSRSTIDIYVDPADDPDIGEIVVVKKKKSRAALEGIRWALGEVSNNGGEAEAPPKDEMEKVKIKAEEKEKWWSIGRGKRDSKEKETAKSKLRAKAPSASAVPSQTAPAPPTVLPRPRNHSLDSGLLLSTTPSASAHLPLLTVSRPERDDCFSADPGTQSHYAQLAPHSQGHPQHAQSRPRFGSSPGLLHPPQSGSTRVHAPASASTFSLGVHTDTERGAPGAKEGGAGSLAFRAMRSVKSLARIGSWAQLRNTPAPGSGSGSETGAGPADPNVGSAGGNGSGTMSGAAEKGEKSKKKKKEKEKEKERKGALAKRAKSSSSSWEVGALSGASNCGHGDGGDDTTRSGHGGGVVGVNAEPGMGAGGMTVGPGSGIGRGLPSHLHLQRQALNPTLNPNSNTHAFAHAPAHAQDRRDSGGTLLSVTTGAASYRSASSGTTTMTTRSGTTMTSATSATMSSGLGVEMGLAPGVDGRRASGCSSSGGSRPGSTYTASGEDTGGFAGVVRGRGKVSVRWGGVVVGGEKGRGKVGIPMLEKEREKAREVAEREKKRAKEREKKEKKEKEKERRSVEGRRRTPVSSVFPGLGMAFGRGEEGRGRDSRSTVSGASVVERDVSASGTGASAPNASAAHVQTSNAPASNVPPHSRHARDEGPAAQAQAQARAHAHNGGHVLDAHDEDGEEEEEEDDHDAELDDDEEACVRIAVHAAVPPFVVRGRGGDGHGYAHAHVPAQTGAGVAASVGSSGQPSNHGLRAGAGSGPPEAQLRSWPVPPRAVAQEDGEAVQRSPPPPARPRPRPVSEQLLGGRPRPRPRGIVGDVVDWVESGDGGEAFALSMLEAANSDLASLINRLDLEATPDSKASRPVSFAVTDPTTSSRLTLGDPESPGPARGGVDDSPLKKMLGSRARASVTSLRPYSYAQGGGGGSGLGPSRFVKGSGDSALRGGGYNEVTVGRAVVPPVPSLHGRFIGQPIVPWASLNVAPKEPKELKALREHKEAQVQAAAGAGAKSAFPTLVRKGRIDVRGVRSSTSTEEEDAVQPLGPPPKYRSQRVGAARESVSPPPTGGGAPVTTAAAAPRIRTSSSELRARAAPFMRAPSVSSTFGSSLVGLHDAGQVHTPSPHEAMAPSSRTFGASRPLPVRYSLPSVSSGSSSPRSVMTAGAETPTPSPRPQRRDGGGGGGGGGGHVRQRNSLVPFVKRVVQSIEAREAMEMEQQQEIEERVKRRSGGSGVSGNSGAAAVRGEGLGVEARRELGFKGTMGVGNDDAAEPFDEEEEDSDIPDELQLILSQSDDTRHSKMGSFPTDAVDDTMSFDSPTAERDVVENPAKSVSLSRLPPSPGLPPAAPLPTPSSTPGVIQMEPSPPAPTFLPFLPPSPSPSPTSLPSVAAPPSASAPAPAPAPTVTVRRVSEDKDNEADIDEPCHTSSGSEDDTKQSFDFTGEIRRLNESGAAHRRSFVEQLENAFKTPSRLGAEALGFELGGFLSVGVGVVGGGQDAGRERKDRAKGDERDGEPDISMMVESLNESLNLLRPQTSVTSKPSYGRLDTAFKFGGKPQSSPDAVDVSDNSVARELPGVAALSTSPSPKQSRASPVLPPMRPRASSTSMVEEDSSVLRSIYAQAAQAMDAVGHRAQPSLALESDTSSKRRARQSHIPTHARSSSDTSFSGMSSFGAVRTKFEFGPQRPAYFEPSFHLSKSHMRHESMISIASMSSYGEVIHSGSNDPFKYGQDSMDNGLPSIDEAMATFDEGRRRKRFSTDSDVSSFYFRAPSQPHVTQHRKDHGRNQSVVSTTSMNGPPISLYNRSFGHKRSDSAGSASSIAHAYGVHGASGGRAAWVRHKQDVSIDSVMSDFSAVRLGRPGVGDKMFESAADHGPLTAISASPPESTAGDLAQKSSYDSILDDDRRSTIDSIFDNTGQRSSVSSDSVFGYDVNEVVRGNLFPPTHYRPMSVISLANPGTPREDDTMISMLGGGHVRRRSIGSSFEASPCVRVEKREKRKHSDFVHPMDHYAYGESPNKARLIRRESVVSVSTTSSKSKFGETRMSLAQQGLLHRNSLEDSCLSAEGEEDFTMHSIRSPVFTRPPPSTRARSRPLVTISQPPDTTPPLSSSEGSQSGESQSSIDIARLKILLQTASAGVTCSSARARARGHGHRRRASQLSRSSAIGTIHEENPGLSNSPSPGHRSNRDSFQSVSSAPPSPREPDLSTNPSVDIVEWDDEQVVVGLRRYYALRNEADETISHSRVVWPDTPFSIHALQTFSPPDHPAGMQALLEHSQKSYIPLPSDLRPRRVRSRKSSLNRPSPYPRAAQHSLSPSRISTKSRRASIDLSASMSFSSSFDKSRALQSIPVSSNNITSPAPALMTLTPFSPITLDLSQSEDNIINVTAPPVPPSPVIKPAIRPRVGSAARRNALGWTKRKTPKSKTTEGKYHNPNKENEAHGMLTSPMESLRIVRPRPRGRMTPTPTPRSTSLLV